jgi:hypothetical protein
VSVIREELQSALLVTSYKRLRPWPRSNIIAEFLQGSLGASSRIQGYKRHSPDLVPDFFDSFPQIYKSSIQEKPHTPLHLRQGICI